MYQSVLLHVATTRSTLRREPVTDYYISALLTVQQQTNNDGARSPPERIKGRKPDRSGIASRIITRISYRKRAEQRPHLAFISKPESHSS